MLEIKKITKIYQTEGFKQTALNKVSVNFRKSEFAAILGPSGSGKTTFLNIIGGLDKYNSGDLIINNVSTKNYSDRQWDSYRNHRVGFVFQSYNLINHQTILKNVELALTLSGISKDQRKERAINALKDVGLEKHMNKKPNQLSGGQMQRVAIARALVNNPEIILADEPTGALDSETSVQIMKILKDISKEKLVIMVTHNPDLAKEYASRIINIKDGEITSDSNPFDGKDNLKEDETNKTSKTKMSFLTALSLSFNNLMTKKGRTILVSVAGSIGIIGIALILAVSTGFQNYVDSIQEETLTSYPLTIMQESSDITSVLLSMRTGEKKDIKEGSVEEAQYITSMLSNISANDLKNFKKYLNDNYKEVKSDLSNVSYNYSINPNIYTIDAVNKLAKLNPSNLFDSMMGQNTLMQSYSSMASIFSKMFDNVSEIESDYEMLKGRWPEKYDEMIIVLSEKSSISDLLVYSLGLRDTEELTTMVTKIMSGEGVKVENEPKTFTYDDLMNLDLRLIMPSDTYKYNSKYDVYEDMSTDEKYMEDLYKKATKLKIVGIVSPKEGTTTMALNPGVNYTSSLIDYIIEYSKETEVVKKQLAKPELDVLSGKRFDAKTNNFNFEFKDLVKVDNKKLQSAFNISISQSDLEKQTKKYMEEISNTITTDTTPANEAFSKGLETLANNLMNSITTEFKLNDIQNIINSLLNAEETNNYLKELETKFVIPSETFKTTYKGLLEGLLTSYITAYNTYMKTINPEFVIDESNPSAIITEELKTTVIDSYLKSAPIIKTSETMAKVMTEAAMKKTILSKIGELTSNISKSFASSFNVDQDKIASAFTLNFSKDELARVVNSMMNKKESTQRTNLILLGYQDKEEPTYISFYFNSFEGKEHFLSFIDTYNKSVDEDKEINYSDTTGILMSSVKTIVNAVSYVLIAFVSISLVVSSIMIGVITYISVYERTKEIGILRAIGASKGNISSIFNAETFIIGFLSGLFGIGISYSLIPIINTILHKYTGNIPLSAALNLDHAGILIVLSIILTLIGGLIPASSASKKDPVEALRSE
ncbi:MAG: ATP-binding cassette domain-containing protein [Tenericutes bacterium]|nr:ATP-binding cassette domain-containing protein [Mycoplasmatota bacterium]